jgi:uncharacterized protein (DUF302 family)
MEKTNYSIRKKVPYDFNTAIEKTKEALQKVGFGAVIEIDFKKTFKEKLDIDFKPYTILGACSASHAHEAIVNEEEIGLMLPCNVLIYEKIPGEIWVSVIDPGASMISVGNENLGELAMDITAKLEKMIELV